MDTTRSGSGKESGLPEKLNLKALFDAFEVAWDEEKSREVFAKVMAKLEQRERRVGAASVKSITRSTAGAA